MSEANFEFGETACCCLSLSTPIASYANGRIANISLTGQIGRTLGPLIFCSLYWWAGREVAYNVGLAGMLAVATIVFGVLRIPPGTERKKKGKKVGEEVKAA